MTIHLTNVTVGGVQRIKQKQNMRLKYRLKHEVKIQSPITKRKHITNSRDCPCM